METDTRPETSDLDVALRTAAEVNRVVAAADIKAGLVLTAQGVLMGGLSTALRQEAALPVFVLSVAALVASGISVLLLLAAIWPRLGTMTVGSGWFGLPSLEIGDRAMPARPAPEALADLAWKQVAELASIARRKFRWFRAAVLVGAVGVGLFVVSPVLAAVATT
jgi:hypothetical protein